MASALGGAKGPNALLHGDAAEQSRAVASPRGGRRNGGGQSELEPAWASVLDDPESQATARHVAMAVSSYDILLLLADLLEGLR
jgi:hypothetical protein